MTPEAHNPDEIIQRVLGRFNNAENVRTGMSRAVLVVDESVNQLAAPLAGANFRVKQPKAGMTDEQIKEDLLEHRVLVTRNTKDFLKDASRFEYGIIGLEGLPFIDESTAYSQNTTAQMIADAWVEFSLNAERYGYVLMLKPDGKHVFKRIP